MIMRYLCMRNPEWFARFAQLTVKGVRVTDKFRTIEIERFLFYDNNPLSVDSNKPSLSVILRFVVMRYYLHFLTDDMVMRTCIFCGSRWPACN